MSVSVVIVKGTQEMKIFFRSLEIRSQGAVFLQRRVPAALGL